MGYKTWPTRFIGWVVIIANVVQNTSNTAFVICEGTLKISHYVIIVITFFSLFTCSVYFTFCHKSFSICSIYYFLPSSYSLTWVVSVYYRTIGGGTLFALYFTFGEHGLQTLLIACKIYSLIASATWLVSQSSARVSRKLCRNVWPTSSIKAFFMDIKSDFCQRFSLWLLLFQIHLSTSIACINLWRASYREANCQMIWLWHFTINCKGLSRWEQSWVCYNIVH